MRNCITPSDQLNPISVNLFQPLWPGLIKCFQTISDDSNSWINSEKNYLSLAPIQTLKIWIILCNFGLFSFCFWSVSKCGKIDVWPLEFSPVENGWQHTRSFVTKIDRNINSLFWFLAVSLDWLVPLSSKKRVEKVLEPNKLGSATRIQSFLPCCRTPFSQPTPQLVSLV